MGDQHKDQPNWNLTASQVIWDRLFRGKIAMREIYYWKAVKDYRATLKLDPENVPVLEEWLALEKERERYVEVLNLANRILKQNPDNILALQNRADLNLIDREYNKAFRDFKRLTELHPENEEYRLKLSIAESKSYEIVARIANAATAMEIGQQDLIKTIGILIGEREIANLQLNEYDPDKIRKHQLELAVSNRSWHWVLAFLLNAGENYLRHFPDDPAGYDYLSRSYYIAWSYRKSEIDFLKNAVLLLDKAIALSPDDRQLLERKMFLQYVVREANNPVNLKIIFHPRKTIVRKMDPYNAHSRTYEDVELDYHPETISKLRSVLLDKLPRPLMTPAPSDFDADYRVNQ